MEVRSLEPDKSESLVGAEGSNSAAVPIDSVGAETTLMVRSHHCD